MNNLLAKDILDGVVAKLAEFDSWLILIHENPDSDTLGCSLALYSLGSRCGKKVRIIGSTPLSWNQHVLPLVDRYEQITELTRRDIADDTLIICVDTSTVARSVRGLGEYVNSGNSLNIDHHGDNQFFAGMNIIAPEASATAEVIAEILLNGGFGIERDEAVCLYAALVTDNGFFKFKSTTPRSHLYAAKLLEAGVDPSQLDDMINQNMTPEILRLWGSALSRTKMFADGTAAFFWVNDADFALAGAGPSAIEGMVNQLLRIKGIKIALLISSYDGRAKLSVRTRAPYSAREIAAVWGGGGHLQAAGASLPGPLESALLIVMEAVEQYVSDRTSAAE